MASSQANPKSSSTGGGSSTKSIEVDWETIAQEYQERSTREEGELSVREFMDKTGETSQTKAYQYLNRMVDEGRATCRKIVLDGHATTIYRLANNV